VNLLLDTHILIWWLGASARLSKSAHRAVTESPRVYVSAATIWEIGIKCALGKLETPENLEEELRNSSFSTLPIQVSHAIAAGKLPRHHDDPFDRMLVAQASLESLTLLTADARLKLYDASILLA
jgi:PIN domain nuclease of toxin-antitoxin system